MKWAASILSLFFMEFLILHPFFETPLRFKFTETPTTKKPPAFAAGGYFNYDQIVTESFIFEAKSCESLQAPKSGKGK